MVLFTKAVLEFLQPQIPGRTVEAFEDNQRAIALGENPISTGRTKLIDARYHFIRELVEKKVLRMVYRKTEKQFAHVLTKPFARESLEQHRCFLMNLPSSVFLYIVVSVNSKRCSTLLFAFEQERFCPDADFSPSPMYVS